MFTIDISHTFTQYYSAYRQFNKTFNHLLSNSVLPQYKAMPIIAKEEARIKQLNRHQLQMSGQHKQKDVLKSSGEASM